MLLSFVLLLCNSQGFIKRKDHKYNTSLCASRTCPFNVFDGDLEAHVNMRRVVTVSLDRQIVVTIQRVLNLIEMFP